MYHKLRPNEFSINDYGQENYSVRILSRKNYHQPHQMPRFRHTENRRRILYLGGKRDKENQSKLVAEKYRTHMPLRMRINFIASLLLNLD